MCVHLPVYVCICSKGQEQNPNDLLQLLNKCIGKVMERQEKTRVKAVGITNQRETTIVWDKTTGKPLHNAICEEGLGNTYVHYMHTLFLLLQCGMIIVLK